MRRDGKMKCIAEARTWKLRVWADDSASYGAPYDWTADMQFHRPGEVEIYGYDKPVTRDIYAAVISELQRLGITRFMRVRYVDGVRREIWHNVLTKTQEFYRKEE